MIKSAEGIILRTVKYGESSIIMDIFSPEEGVKSYIIGGVRSKKAKTKASLLAILNFVQFVYYNNNSRSLSRIKEVQFEHVYRRIPFEITRSSMALLLAEVLRKSLKVTDSNTELYQFVKDRFLLLDEVELVPNDFHIKFLLDLSSLLGFALNNNYSVSTPYFNLEDGSFTSFNGDLRYLLAEEPSKHLAEFLSGVAPIIIRRQERIQLLKHILDFYRYHIEGFGTLKSLDILTQLYK